MRTLSVEGTAELVGSVTMPPDKSISHRALIFSALGEGACEIRPLSGGGDNKSTQRVLRELGVKIEVDGDRALVHGIGDPSSFEAVESPLDCGNSGTTMRMMAGVLAASGKSLRLTGDESLQKRPMSRLRPLEEMGARISGREEGGKLYPPIQIDGGRLVGKRHELKVASAQVKSAILLAGLFAEGETTVLEPERSRDHTERMLRRLGIAVDEAADGALTVRRRAKPWSVDRIEVAPDPSSAAFFVAAAMITGSPALIVNCSVNPTRTGFLDVLRAMGASVREEVYAEVWGEPVARLSIEPSRLRGTVISGPLAVRAIDELPVLAAVATAAREVAGSLPVESAGGQVLVRIAGRVRAMAKGYVRWWEWLPPFVVVGRRPRLRRLARAQVEALLDAAFGAEGAAREAAATGAEAAQREAELAHRVARRDQLFRDGLGRHVVESALARHAALGLAADESALPTGVLTMSADELAALARADAAGTRAAEATRAALEGARDHLLLDGGAVALAERARTSPADGDGDVAALVREGVLAR
jgi:3-phosphoshikimate 1-carboxyvinyltransferase